MRCSARGEYASILQVSRVATIANLARDLHMTILGSVMLVEMLLCGKTDAPLMYSSSLMVTSSPRTVIFSRRACRVNTAPRSTPAPTHPSADIAVPSDDRVGNPRVVSDGRIGQDDGSLQTDTRADLGTGANDDVGADNSGGVDLGGLSSVASHNAISCGSPRRQGRFRRRPICSLTGRSGAESAWP